MRLHVSYTPCFTNDEQAFPSHIVVLDGKGEMRNYTPELTCHSEEVYIDNYSDLTVTVCSNCRVAIDELEDCYYCPNCGAKVVEK